MKTIKIKCLDENCMPTKAHDTDAGYDLYAARRALVLAGKSTIVPTGVILQLPEEEDYIWEAQIRPRSGLSAKTCVRVANAPGTIDAGYTGEIGVILSLESSSDSPDSYIVTKYDRIAQLVITRIPKIKLEPVDEISETDRGSDGFGSSGK